MAVVIMEDLAWRSAIYSGPEKNSKDVLISDQDWSDHTKDLIRFRYESKDKPSGVWHADRSWFSINNNHMNQDHINKDIDTHMGRMRVLSLEHEYKDTDEGDKSKQDTEEIINENEDKEVEGKNTSNSNSNDQSKLDCFSIMERATNNKECQDEYLKQENDRLQQENLKLLNMIKQLNGNQTELHKLDMECLCELEEKLEISLLKVRETREKYYEYYCIECELKQSYVLINGCHCHNLCAVCIKQKKIEFGAKCPNCDQLFT